MCEVQRGEGGRRGEGGGREGEEGGGRESLGEEKVTVDMQVLKPHTHLCWFVFVCVVV